MGKIVDVKSMVEKKKKTLKKEVEKLSKNGIVPKLSIILANNLDASKIYVSNKKKLCSELGVLDDEYIFDESCSSDDIVKTIEMLNADDNVDGILIQLPLFKHLDQNRIVNAVDPKKDADGLHPINLGKILSNEPGNIACTPKGILYILSELKCILEGKNAVIIGRSLIVGKPMANLLINKGATVTVCNSKTKNISKITKKADLIIVATGVPGLLKKDMVKKGATVIDVGINKVDGKTVGDVVTAEVALVAMYVTPVPGGVGLTTVLSLVDNVVEIAKNRLHK